MARQKSTHPVAKSLQKTQDSESSSSSDHSDSESDSPVPSKPVAKNPRTKPTVTKVSPKDSSSQSSGSEDEETSSDSPSDSDSDDVQVPPKASTLKRSRCDDGSPTENARPSKRVTKGPKYIFHKSYNESNGACTILAGKTYFKVFYSFDTPRSLNTRNSFVYCSSPKLFSQGHPSIFGRNWLVLKKVVEGCRRASSRQLRCRKVPRMSERYIGC